MRIMRLLEPVQRLVMADTPQNHKVPSLLQWL